MESCPFEIKNKILVVSEGPGFPEWQMLEEISEDHLVQPPCSRQSGLEQAAQDLVQLVHFIFRLQQFPM